MGLKETGKWVFLHGTPIGLEINRTKNMIKTIDYMISPENLGKHVMNVAEKGPVIGTIKSATEGYVNAKVKVFQDEVNDAIAYSPVTTIPYNIGKNNGHYEGKKEGIVETSSEYKKVFQDQEQRIIKVKEEAQKCNDEHVKFEDEIISQNERLKKGKGNSMFLEMLDDEKRVLFLNLAAEAANINGVLEKEEKDLLELYAYQIDVDPIIKSDYSIEELSDKINNVCDLQEKRMILFELVGIMFSDKMFDNKEKDFLQKLASDLCVSNEEIEDMISLMNEYKNLYEKTFEKITKE